MTSSSANDPANLADPHLIVDLFPRRRSRRYVSDILDALVAEPTALGNARRRVAAANAIFGDDVVVELQRAIDRDSPRFAAAAIVVLCMIATEPARAVLWQIGRGRRYGPLLQLDALRALSQLGEHVDIREMVALANLCEGLPPPQG